MLLLALVLSGLAVAPLSAALQGSAGWEPPFPSVTSGSCPLFPSLPFGSYPCLGDFL